MHSTLGKRASTEMLIDVGSLIDAYYAKQPDPTNPNQRVEFGTSGHRGSSLNQSFNENHILAITQAICLFRHQQNIHGPLFLGMDTHALSMPALKTALEVLAANGITVMLSDGEPFTPTPAISLAILTYNQSHQKELADGIVITPSHNPPDEGGFKYNPPHGGPAELAITEWIQDKANEILSGHCQGIKKISFEKALQLPTTKKYDYLKNYVTDLANVIDMEIIRNSKIHMGVDPLGGAGVHYWQAIAEHYGLDLTVVSDVVDPTFRFMPLDWDGKIRMDPSSSYAMQGLIGLKEQFDIAFACDTDHDRHGIVSKGSGLIASNHYLTAAIFYLFNNRPLWNLKAGIGKTIVSTQMIDRVASKLGRNLYEVPVGFKWFVEGLLNGTLGFVGEESAGASFLRLNGQVWTTDKDGILLGLLAAEMTAKLGKDPSELYKSLTTELGEPIFDRIEAPIAPQQKKILKNLKPQNVLSTQLAGEKISSILTDAPGNGASIGGLKVVTENGWFAARPSGTENIYKIYAESFLGKEHLNTILKEAQTLVDQALINRPLA